MVERNQRVPTILSLNETPEYLSSDLLLLNDDRPNRSEIFSTFIVLDVDQKKLIHTNPEIRIEFTSDDGLETYYRVVAFRNMNAWVTPEMRNKLNMSGNDCLYRFWFSVRFD